MLIAGSAGIGVFISFVGLKDSGIIVGAPFPTAVQLMTDWPYVHGAHAFCLRPTGTASLAVAPVQRAPTRPVVHATTCRWLGTAGAHQRHRFQLVRALLWRPALQHHLPVAGRRRHPLHGHPHDLVRARTLQICCPGHHALAWCAGLPRDSALAAGAPDCAPCRAGTCRAPSSWASSSLPSSAG